MKSNNLGSMGYNNEWSCVHLGVPAYAHSASDRPALLRALAEAPDAAESVDMHFHILVCKLAYPKAILSGYDERWFQLFTERLCSDTLEGVLQRALSRPDLVIDLRRALSQTEPYDEAVWNLALAAADWPQNVADAREHHELLHAQDHEDERRRQSQIGALTERIAGGLRAYAAFTYVGPMMPEPIERRPA